MTCVIILIYQSLILFSYVAELGTHVKAWEWSGTTCTFQYILCSMHSILNSRDEETLVGVAWDFTRGGAQVPSNHTSSFMTTQNSLSFALFQFHDFQECLWSSSVIYPKAIKFLGPKLFCNLCRYASDSTQRQNETMLHSIRSLTERTLHFKSFSDETIHTSKWNVAAVRMQHCSTSLKQRFHFAVKQWCMSRYFCGSSIWNVSNKVWYLHGSPGYF